MKKVYIYKNKLIYMADDRLIRYQDCVIYLALIFATLICLSVIYEGMYEKNLDINPINDIDTSRRVAVDDDDFFNIPLDAVAMNWMNEVATFNRLPADMTTSNDELLVLEANQTTHEDISIQIE